MRAGRTFLEAREAEEFDEAQVVAGGQHGAAVVGVHRVDVGYVGVFGPDAVDFGAQHAGPRHPVGPLGLLLGHQLTRCRGGQRSPSLASYCLWPVGAGPQVARRDSSQTERLN